MYLTYRLARDADLDISFNYVRDRLGYAEAVRKDVVQFWRELIQTGLCIALVVEDRDQPKDTRVVGFRLTFFATEEFVHKAKTSDGPFLHRRVLDLWRRKVKFSLRADEFQREHALAGLNIVALHWGWDTVRYAPEDVVNIQEYLSQSYQTEIARYRTKEYMEEVYGTEERDRLISFGLKVVRDFRDGSSKKSTGDVRHPYLLNVTLEIRKDASKRQTVAGRIAALTAPRFGFKLAEHEVLKLALEGATDEEIAAEIRLSVAAVKKRWQGIFQKVLTVEPDFFDAVADVGENVQSKPRRRFLLRVLKQHPEEMWPQSADPVRP